MFLKGGALRQSMYYKEKIMILQRRFASPLSVYFVEDYDGSTIYYYYNISFVPAQAVRWAIV